MSVSMELQSLIAKRAALAKELDEFDRIITLEKSAKHKRPRNSLTLAEAVLIATADKPLTKREILEAVKGTGYTFATVTPMTSLHPLLFKGGMFKNKDGKFWPAIQEPAIQEPAVQE